MSEWQQRPGKGGRGRRGRGGRASSQNWRNGVGNGQEEQGQDGGHTGGGRRGGQRGNRHRGGQGGAARGGGQGGQVHRGNSRRPYNPENVVIGYKTLEAKARSSPSEAVLFCYQKSFTDLLMRPVLEPDWVDLLLTIIELALQADDTLNNMKLELKDNLTDQNVCFLTTTCPQRFTTGLHSSSIKIDKLLVALRNYLDIFHHLCAMDPLISQSLITSVRMVQMVLKGSSMTNEHLNGVSELYDQATAELERKEREREELAKRQKMLRITGRILTDQKPIGDFRDLAVYPTEEDLTAGVELRPNLVNGAYSSVEDYLDIQFRLLREDFVSTMREGIKKFKENPNLKGPNRFRSGDIRIYDNLRVVSVDFGQNGLNHIISIDKSSPMFQRTKWESTKKLMYGSMLCLSQDGFDSNNLFAVISERKAEVITKEGVFEICFLPESLQKFDRLPNKKAPFMAVESSAYYEAYKHVLSGMKKLSEENFAFSKYIVRAQPQISVPEYARFIETNYRFITADNGVTAAVSIFRDDVTSNWPSAETLGFNQSQYEAYKMALTKEFVVIQGPPGTGKTFIGLKIVETLLYNLYNVPYAEVDRQTAAVANKKHAIKSSMTNKEQRKAGCPQRRMGRMLIVCFTNHALDQFLEGMLSFCPIEDMVRVGSRSKNETLAQCNIKNRRVRRSGQLQRTFREFQTQKTRFLETNHIEDMSRALSRSRTTLLRHDTSGLFSDYPEFYEQLDDLAGDLEDGGKDPNLAVNVWLEEDHLSASLARINLSDDYQMQAGSEEGTELINVEGEAERELENRMLDLDEEDEFTRHIRKYSYMTKVQLKNSKQPEVDEDGFQKPKSRKSNNVMSRKVLEKKINSIDEMTEVEVSRLRSLVNDDSLDITTGLPLEQRWRLYKHLLSQYTNRISNNMSLLHERYKTITAVDEDIRMQTNIATLKQAKVIGMTTTGAARLQSVLQQVGPEIVVVEEAAEVLEAHIITALSKHCKHLILIGDHKQLKPNPTVYDLAKNYNLDLSLFERMVNNGLPVKTLNIQHRMRPEVSKYIRGHIYDRLDDHPTVCGREAIEGVKQPVFFFNHDKPETLDVNTVSHSNAFEADMVVELTRYLLRQESYKPEDITIITMYTGQLLLIKNKMPRYEFQGVKITSVDNFQGEENKILVISLVRSNMEGKLGFVKIENRVCVSLSRAQYGMYVFGNFDQLARGSSLWRKIVEEAKDANELGNSLNLSCQKHNNPAVIETPHDFRTKAPSGGCQLKCNTQLDCGHICKMTCHSKDLNHVEYKCTERCTKKLSPCGHKCPAMCHSECPKCRVMMSTKLACDHTRSVECYKLHTGESIPCVEPCPKMLECSHPCTNKCSEKCTTQCLAPEEQMCSRCNEMKTMPCYLATERLRSLTTGAMNYSYKCDTPCDVTLDCGHKCTGDCFNCNETEHSRCTMACNKQLSCGHFCSKLCGDHADSGGCSDCSKKCQLRCSHGVKCSKDCNSGFCLFIVKTEDKKCQWGCKHVKCERQCGEPCSFVPCDQSCDKVLTCKTCKQKYPCLGICGQKCPRVCPSCDLPEKVKLLEQQVDDVTVTMTTKWITLEDCSHLLPVDYIDGLVYASEPQTSVQCPYKSCQRLLLNTPRYTSRTRATTDVKHHYIEPEKPRQQTKPPKKQPQQQLKPKNGSISLQPLLSMAPAMQQAPVVGAQAMPAPPPPHKTAKQRRRENRRGPPPPPRWMDLSNNQPEFERTMQEMRDELEVVKETDMENPEDWLLGDEERQGADISRTTRRFELNGRRRGRMASGRRPFRGKPAAPPDQYDGESSDLSD